jgi:hypothetical protein
VVIEPVGVNPTVGVGEGVCTGVGAAAVRVGDAVGVAGAGVGVAGVMVGLAPAAQPARKAAMARLPNTRQPAV